MKRLVVFLMVLGLLIGGSGMAQAYSWQTTPILGINSSYDGNVLIDNGSTPWANIPHDVLDGIIGQPATMTAFTVGQSIHTGSGVFLDSDTYWTGVFTNLSTASAISYSGTASSGFWMTWNTPAGGGDGAGVATLTNADVGRWQYTETYSAAAGATPFLSYTADFTVSAVPEPATMLLLGLGLVGLTGVRRRIKK